MLLAIDVGNTNIFLGVFDADLLVESWRLGTLRERTADDIARTLAIVVLAGFGISLLVPPIGDRIEAFASRIAPGPARIRGEGFGSGLVVGASLGLVYAPCAGPILAGVITVSASQDFTAGKLAVALSYAVGSGLVLYGLILGGRRLVDRAFTAHIANEQRLVAALDADTRAALERILRTWLSDVAGDEA